MRRMPPLINDALLEQLAQIARLLEVERIELHGVDGRQRTLCSAVFAAGARRARHVLQYDQEQPVVLEKAVLTISCLTLEVSAPPRPASPGERAALASETAFFCLDSCRVVEPTDVD